MESPESVRRALTSRAVAVRKAELGRLDHARLDDEDARRVLPVLIDHLARESNPRLRATAAWLVVRSSDGPLSVPGVVEGIASALMRAGTRDATHGALARLRAAAGKGWDMTRARPLLVDLCLTPWVGTALDVLTTLASQGVDVLDGSGVETAMPLWEVLRLTLEFQVRNADVREKALRLVLADARHRKNHLARYGPDILLAATDERMNPVFKEVAAACLEALRTLDA